MMWFHVAGLDRHTPLIGLRPLSKRMASVPESRAPPPQVQHAIYRPISEVHRTPS